MSGCGTTPEGGWHCEGTGCQRGICLHDAAVPGIGLSRPIVVSEADLTTNHRDFRAVLRARYG